MLVDIKSPEIVKGHPFGDLLSEYLHRRHGLSQAKLASGILQDPSIIGKMCKGQRLTGRQARERVVAIVGWLIAQGAIDRVEEADALLAAAGLVGLREDGAAERDLLLQLRPATRAERAAGAHVRRTNLPAPLTTFVGRTQALAEVGRLIAARRLVTLTGDPGVGKTRLAVEVGMRAVQSETRFAGGVWLVDYGARLHEAAYGPATAGALPAAIAQAIKLPDRNDDGSTDEREQAALRVDLEALVEHLADREVLLILNNCDFFSVEEIAQVEHLLEQCWQLHVVATCREPLHLSGETVYPVLPLGYPPRDGEPPQRLLTYPAVQLFVDRMAVVRPTVRLTEEELGVAARICRKLRGMPMAIELAASLSHTLTLSEIAAQFAAQPSAP